MTFKRFLCKIFGHKYEIGLYKSEEYKTYNNGWPSGRKTKHKRAIKKRIVKHWKRCERCGAFILYK